MLVTQIQSTDRPSSPADTQRMQRFATSYLNRHTNYRREATQAIVKHPSPYTLRLINLRPQSQPIAREERPGQQEIGTSLYKSASSVFTEWNRLQLNIEKKDFGFEKHYFKTTSSKNFSGKWQVETKTDFIKTNSLLNYNNLLRVTMSHAKKQKDIFMSNDVQLAWRRRNSLNNILKRMKHIFMVICFNVL